METYPLIFAADTQLKIVNQETRDHLKTQLAKYGQQKILKILAEGNEQVNAKVFSELADFNFDVFHNYFERFKTQTNLISDVSKTKSIPENCIRVKKNTSKAEINKVENIGLKKIAEGKGYLKSRRDFTGCWGCKPPRV